MAAHVTVRGWVWNFDAEMELERGRNYQRTRELEERVAALIRSEGRRAMTTGDFVVGCDRAGEDAVGMAWCPTPLALAALKRAGLRLGYEPPGFDVLRAVNERGFAHGLASRRSDFGHRVTSSEGAFSLLESPSPSGQWLCKRAFGVAGRGQRAMRPGSLTENDRNFVRASLRSEALYIEPRVAIECEYSIHGWAFAGRVVLRSIRRQTVGAQGAYASSERARNLPVAIERALIACGEDVGGALLGASYCGPFGIDAFAYRSAGGTLELRALSEINARFCMGWDAADLWDSP